MAFAGIVYTIGDSMAERKIFNFKSEMLVDLTIKNEGYHPDTFGRTSNKFIWATCRFCGEPSRIRKGHFIKKGSACHKECRFKEQSISGSPFADPEVKEKTRQTNLARYGVEHASQNKEIAKRISQSRMTEESKAKSANTNLDRYGVVNPFQSEEIKEKCKQTNLEKYGTEHAMQSDEIKKKTIETLKSKYGVDNLASIPGAKDKKILTNMERYGCENPMQSEEIKSKTKDTNISKYGVSNPMQNESIRQKAYETNIEKYGYPHALQNKDIMASATASFKKSVIANESGKFNLSNALRGNKFWEAMKEGKSIKQLCEEFDLQANSLGARLLNPEFAQLYYNTYTFPKNQMQRDVMNEIQKYPITIIFNDHRTIKPFELDIYFPDNNFAIEFNGNFWHSEAYLSQDKAKTKHINKTRLCQEKGVRLFHIFEHQWIKRRFQILNFIKTILGVNSIKIAARKCTITEDMCKKFYDDNHIQSWGKRTIKCFNLVYNNEIVASMSAASHHRQNVDKNAIVLNRLCFKDGVNVQGGSTKLFKHFIDWAKSEGYNKIISWSDNCWTDGGIYKVLGFTLEEEYGPDYFYWDNKNRITRSKQSQQKKKTGCPEDMTEREWCIQNNLYRVWNCGKKKWIFNLVEK